VGPPPPPPPPPPAHQARRCFVGNLGNEVDDNSLIRAFQSYPSFQRAKVIFDKRLRKTRGYGFVSFKNAECFSKALREMQARDGAAAPLTIHSSTTRLSLSARATHSRRALQGKYIGNRPITIRKSEYQERSLGAGVKRHRD
jgi:RNA recognition motif-containing protein